ncbi:uncharacterized protein LOC110858617 isoform X1 [Folsomia candida]|uniref:uncharacterized protein LOC110858617 isoform X1 n=1 Tax=Folsomia candida TaxID=158441 RepID=UPI001604EFE8|nr:uncharacterized protein LOC110858617 isoform X1 [Folsomia candida]
MQITTNQKGCCTALCSMSWFLRSTSRGERRGRNPAAETTGNHHTDWFSLNALGQGGGEGVKRGEEEEERVPLEKLPQIIRQHLIQKLNITAPVQQGRGFFDALGTAVGAGMKLAYHAADAVTFGATTSLIDKAKEAAINVAIDAYTSGMLNKRDVGEAEAGLDPPLSN